MKNNIKHVFQNKCTHVFCATNEKYIRNLTQIWWKWNQKWCMDGTCQTDLSYTPKSMVGNSNMNCADVLLSTTLVTLSAESKSWLKSHSSHLHPQSQFIPLQSNHILKGLLMARHVNEWVNSKTQLKIIIGPQLGYFASTLPRNSKPLRLANL